MQALKTIKFIYTQKTEKQMKKIYMILRISALTLMTLLTVKTTAFAQEEATTDSTVVETPKDRPVRPAFEGGLLFDDATTTLNPSKSMEFILEHRFGYIDTQNDTWDFFGIWGASNIRIAMNYSFLDNLTVGLGTTKFNKMEDLQIKYRIIEQTRSNKIPVTVMLYEVVGVNGSKDAIYGENYKFNDRISYFTQLLVSRRFNDKFSLQVGGAFTHYNSVDSIYNHDRITMSFDGRYKFSAQSSVIFAGSFPLNIKSIEDYQKIAPADAPVYNRPNLSLGMEIATSTHTFQIYFATSQMIVPQEDAMWNKNYTPESVWNKDSFFTGNILLGLNITRLWNF
jgi:hypothetical protein